MIACGHVWDSGTGDWDYSSCYWGYGYSAVTCGDVGCGGNYPQAGITTGCGQETVGIVGSISESTGSSPPTYGEVCIASYCTVGTSKCKELMFPSGSNGQSCSAIDKCWNFGCSNCIQTGKWDASDPDSGDGPACVSCDGKKEEWIRGDTSAIYAGCSGFPSGCNDPGNAGDDQCESACGADSECDERDYGLNVPVPGGVCDNCDFTSAPTISFSPSSFTFTAGYGGSNPTNQGLEIWNSGPSGSVLHWSVSDNAAWLSLSPTSGISTGSLDESDVWLSVSIAGLSYGTHSATITISDPDATNSPRTVPVTLTIAIPNLQVSDIYDFGSDGKVNYSVQNVGNWYTPEDGFYNSLYVDGVYEDYQFFGYSLAAGAYWDGEFSGWTCTPYQTHTIEVCADERNGSSKMVAESNENDNCRTVDLLCPIECTGDINASPETTTAPCDYTIDIYDIDYCQGLTWRVERDGSYVDSGTVTSDTNWDETIYDYGVGVDSSIYYRLYIDGDQKDYDAVVCQEGIPTTCAEAGGNCRENTCPTYTDCSSAAEDYDCSAPTPYCCIGSCYIPFDFEITSVVPDSGSTTQGNATDPSAVTATLLSGTSQSVSFYIGSGLPAGASASFSSSCFPTCTSSMTIFTSSTTPIGTYPLVVCGTGGGLIQCHSSYSLTVWPAVPDLTLPEVDTLGATNITATSVTLNGQLLSLGYDPGTCLNCQCVVWFEYGTSGTEGVSGSYGNSTTPMPMAATGNFTADVPGPLTPDTNYKFEAFVKNGGSW